MNDSLTRFANILYAEAIEEKTKIKKRLDDEKEEALSKCDADLEKKYKREMAKFNSSAENEQRLTLSRREVELMTELRKIRQTAEARVMDKVVNKLKEFTDSEMYTEYLKKQAEASDMFNTDDTVCYARECDFDKLQEILKLDKLEFVRLTDDAIGGFILKSTKLGIMADCTLKESLEEKRELFLEISGLIID